ncbi:histidine kinase [Streptomyces lateritius]|uniref:histidine kinase n=1 Tax=Streptomyces lateritius TaxID=67313 RepID=A0ABW6YCD1_9ACTN
MRERLRERLLDLGLWTLLCVPVLLRSDPNDGGSWTRVAAGTAVLGAAVAVSRRWPLVPVALTVGASLSASLELFTASYVLALIAFGYLAGRRQEHTRAALWLFGAVAAAGLLLTRLAGVSLGQWFTLLLVLALAIVAPWLIGRYVRQYDRLVRSGWELADRMEREQAVVADRERVRERSRIAGDMHDSLGHDLALIALRAGALELAPGLGPDQRAAAGELRRAAADATSRLRDIIGVLRAEDTPAPTAPTGEPVDELVAWARASGLAVELTGSAGPALPAMADRALYRVVQEALTNAAKHAPGASVDVRISRTDETVEVRVVNGPPLEGGATGGAGGPAPRGTGRPGGPASGRTSGPTGTPAEDPAPRAAGRPGGPASGRAGTGPPAGGPASRRTALHGGAPRGCPSGGTGRRLPGLSEGAGGFSGGADGFFSGGTGLVGLDERVRLAGGSLRHGLTAEGGFELCASLPLRVPASPPAPRPAAPTSARELDRARRQVRRGLAQAIWIPSALLVALALLMGGVALHTQHQSYLEPEDYARLQVGRSRAEVGAHLPDRPLDGPPERAPAEPPGTDECLYYRSTLLATIPVYRLCFTDGHLASRSEVP